MTLHPLQDDVAEGYLRGGVVATDAGAYRGLADLDDDLLEVPGGDLESDFGNVLPATSFKSSSEWRRRRDADNSNSSSQDSPLRNIVVVPR